MRWIIALTTLLLALPAAARKYEGVTLPDTIELGGHKLVLNGMGLREKVFVDVYVAGLYLPAKTKDASKAINDDVPKRIQMVMKRDVGKDKLAETMRDSINASGQAAAKAKANTLAGWMESVKEGDHIVLDYVPGKGSTVTVKGKVKGTIEGVPMMKALWGIYLGKSPPSSALKKGLLGK